MAVDCKLTPVRRSPRASSMRASLVLAAIGSGLLAIAPMGHAFASDVYVLGDSIGEDIGRVAKQKTLAKVSVSIANHWIYRQLPNVPKDSTVVMSLGTNDADNTGGVGHLGKHIDAIVEAAKAQNLKLYWLGPVCVRTGSDGRSATLDKILQDKLASTSVTYVSMRKPALCDPSLHAHDGQHFRDAGSKLIWQEVVRVAGFGDNHTTASAPEPVVDAPTHTVAVASPPAKAAAPAQPLPTKVSTAPHLLPQPKVAVPVGPAASASFATGSIQPMPTTRLPPAPATSVPAQVSLEIVPIGLPRASTPVKSAAMPATQTPVRTTQLIEPAATGQTR